MFAREGGGFVAGSTGAVGVWIYGINFANADYADNTGCGIMGLLTYIGDVWPIGACVEFACGVAWYIERFCIDGVNSVPTGV